MKAKKAEIWEVPPLPDSRLVTIRETPGERAAICLEMGRRLFPRNVRVLYLTKDASQPVLPAG